MVTLGVVAILVGMAVLVIEAHVPTAGVLGLAGVMAAAAGAGMVMAGAGASLFLAVPVAVVLALGGTGATLWMAREVFVAHRRAVRTGPRALIGTSATVRTWGEDQGQVAADGTLWHARMSYWSEGPEPAPGETVIVDELEGLTLSVHRPDPWEVMPTWKPSSPSL